jgi:hypothetical protein
MAELYRVFNHLYGPAPLPDDDAGRDDIRLAFQVISTTSNAAGRMKGIAGTWAPWMQPDELEALIVDVTANPRRFKADTIAARMGITATVRALLDLRTIGAIDKPAAQRAIERREAQRLAKEMKRRATGALPIDEARRQRSITAAAKHQRPWNVEGISRATWYRRRQSETQHAA